MKSDSESGSKRSASSSKLSNSEPKSRSKKGSESGSRRAGSTRWSATGGDEEQSAVTSEHDIYDSDRDMYMKSCSDVTGVVEVLSVDDEPTNQVVVQAYGSPPNPNLAYLQRSLTLSFDSLSFRSLAAC